MSEFPKESFDTLGYYVYRLIDPRNEKTFYVGKGCKNRVFAHVNDELRFAETSDDNSFNEDEVSAKIQTIRDIRKAGLQVKHIIHRYGMDEKEALEVEAALIDVYSELGELTNEQSGLNPERGLIETDELIKTLNAPEYDEPIDINYIIIKTKNSTIKVNGSLYEATRRSWKLSLNRVQKYPYVLSTIDGIVKEVYKVDKWYRSDESNEYSRIQFDGKVAPRNIRNYFINKKLPSVYRTKGSANPVLYKRSNNQTDANNQTLQMDTLKIDELAQIMIPKLILNGYVSQRELDLMQKKEYSKRKFGLNFSVLAKTNSAYNSKHYYTNICIVVNSISYALCCEWSENAHNNVRPLLETWIKAHDFDNM